MKSVAAHEAFTGVEELEAAAQALGWHIEYRQMRPGSFRAELSDLECEDISFASERFDNHLHVECEPPDGFVGIFLPQVESGRLSACGRVLEAGELIAFPPGSELLIVTGDVIENEAIFLEESRFRDLVRSLAPSADLLASDSAVIQSGDPERSAAIRRNLQAVHQAGSLDAEATSMLLAATVLWMAAASLPVSAERLANGATAAIARRAQAFVEDRFRNVIRLEELCAFTGVGLRTLQRCFASHFQISPTDYIKARRLNAARRALVMADSAAHSVTRIAGESGFLHLGRFSGDYRAHFGELPSTTLAATNRVIARS